jgi:hypothetical protein
MPDSFEWIDTNDVTTALTVGQRARGLYGTKARYGESPRGDAAGAVTEVALDESRTLLLPVILTDSSEAGLRSQIRDLVAKMHLAKGEGRIRVTDSGGSARDLDCRCIGGFEALDGQLGPTSAVLPLTFKAPDPYWQDATVSSGSSSQATQAAEWLPILPLTLVDTNIFDAPTITVTGDVEAWPIWTLTGPFTSVTIENTTTDKSWTLTFTASSSETIIMDFTTGNKSITRVNTGNSLLANFSGAMWPLAAGANALSISATGADSVTLVEWEYQDRYLSI